MCGRYASVATTADLRLEFVLDEVIGPDLAPSWNIAPTDPVRVVVQRESRAGDSVPPVRQLRTMRWGLVPSWSQTPARGAKMINARIETVSVKPAFKAAAARRRALIPSLGYFEWQQTDDGKIPYFLHHPDRRLLAFAGLYELWRDPERSAHDPDRWLWTCTIITRPATDLLGHIHNRSPVIVPAHLHEAWLTSAGDDAGVARALLDQVPDAALQPDVVSAAVGNVGNNGPELIEPVHAGRPNPERSGSALG
ncbi:MAG: SOS response-associated peptidase [Actinomycetota bacterium]|nr:SOS response-associated peptidase [Actinomycetota bacterium]